MTDLSLAQAEAVQSLLLPAPLLLIPLSLVIGFLSSLWSRLLAASSIELEGRSQASRHWKGLFAYELCISGRHAPSKLQAFWRASEWCRMLL